MRTAGLIGACAGGALALSAAAGAWLLLGEGRGAREVDFSVRAESERRPDADRGELRVAVTSLVSPTVAGAYHEDLFRFAAERMGMGVRFVRRGTYADVNRSLRNGEIDAAFVCPAPYVKGRADFGLDMLVVPVVRGKTTYEAYTIVSADSPMRSFEDLEGKKFAFTDPDSHSGTHVPRATLAKMGRKPESFFKEIVYTYAHDSSIRAVADGRVHGASVDSLIYDFLSEISPRLIAKTKVLAKDGPFGIQPLVVSPALDARLRARLERNFLSIHGSAGGAEVLRRMRIDRFVKGTEKNYDGVREVLAISERGGRDEP